MKNKNPQLKRQVAITETQQMLREKLHPATRKKAIAKLGGLSKAKCCCK
jgi:hypothetical protein